MINKAKFVYYVARERKTQRDVAAALGLTSQALYFKLNGRSDFRLKEVNIITKFLHLSSEERDDMFFGNVV